MDFKPVFNLTTVDPSWDKCIKQALTKMKPDYLEELARTPHWLPGPQKIFNAFSLPLNQVNYILLGESPYPRPQSANGYAFWDAAVGDLWTHQGLSKSVNRATSLRNLIKMLLIAEGLLNPDQIGQPNIANLNKQNLVQTNLELFTHLLEHGFLLLNATPVLRPDYKRQDTLAWRPFIAHVVQYITEHRPNVCLLLLGGLANKVGPMLEQIPIQKLYAEHPYNLSFIHNPMIIDFFKPFHLLLKNNNLINNQRHKNFIDNTDCSNVDIG